jgi:hypothetical protein
MNWVKLCSQITLKKVEHIMTTTKLEPSGVVMRNPETGAMTIVEQGAVKTLSKDQAWNLMHPTQPTQKK